VSDEHSWFQTDPETGISWLVSSAPGGIWLSGHLRDGTPLPGTEAEGGVLILPQGVPVGSATVYWPALAPEGEEAMVAWHGYDETMLQRIVAGSAVSDAIVLADHAGSLATKKALMRVGAEWWMGLLNPSTPGIESVWLSDTEMLSREVLVAHSDCRPSCELGQDYLLDVRSFYAVRWQDELWLGFWDLSDAWTGEGHPVGVSPYRVVRVEPGCRYPKMWEANHR
jgi:hypothetical protein